MTEESKSKQWFVVAAIVICLALVLSAVLIIIPRMKRGGAPDVPHPDVVGPPTKPSIPDNFEPRFIDQPGTHDVVPGSKSVRIRTRDGGLAISILTQEDGEQKGTFGPAETFVKDPGKSWFVWVATPAQYWLYDGEEKLVMYELTGDGVEARTDGFIDYPAPVAERVPEAILYPRDDAVKPLD